MGLGILWRSEEMKRKLLTAVALAAGPLFATGFASTAMALITLNITDVTTGATTGNLPGTLVPGGSTVSFNGVVGNWTINLTNGLSNNTPGLANIDLSSLNSKTSTADTLDIKLSDTGYTFPTADFTLASLGNLITCTAGTCTAALKGFFSNTNALFAETTQINGTLGGSASYNQSVDVLASPTNPYSLTLDLLLTETAAGSTEWSTDSSIKAS